MKLKILVPVFASWGQLVTADPTVVLAPEDCILAMNLARTARLAKRVPLLTVSKEAKETMIKSAEAYVEGDECKDVKPCDTASAFCISYMFDGNDPRCREKIPAQVKSLLTKYPDGFPVFSPTKPPWSDNDMNFAGRVLWDKMSSIACAITTSCARNLLICENKPEIQVDTQVFSPEYYAALQNRNASGVDLSKLTSDDLNTPPGGKADSGRMQEMGLAFVALAIVASIMQAW